MSPLPYFLICEYSADTWLPESHNGKNDSGGNTVTAGVTPLGKYADTPTVNPCSVLRRRPVRLTVRFRVKCELPNRFESSPQGRPLSRFQEPGHGAPGNGIQYVGSDKTIPPRRSRQLGLPGALG